jgi:hypothetical protein
MNFRCNLYSGENDTILCMNSKATCERQASGGESCICPSGFVRDYTGLHIDNCSMPEDYLKILFSACTVPMFIAIVSILSKVSTLQIGVRKLALAFSLCLLFQWAWILSIYLDNGSYEASVCDSSCFRNIM